MTGARGRLLTFEGIDGAGKSTHLNWFAERLRARGHDVVVTREPGGTAVGEKLREVLLHEPMAPDTEALLMFAARRQSVIEVIEPALAAGRWVLSDRFTDATFAYQGGGKGVPAARLDVLERWAQQGLQPERTYLFDLDPDEALKRMSTGRSLDKFESAGTGFFKRVRAAYLERARLDTRRFFVLDAELPIVEIQTLLEESIRTL